MAFQNFPEQQDVVQLLQRSLERGRLGHAYLFNGSQQEELEAMARTLAKTLNCLEPPRRNEAGLALDCCDACLNCRKIESENHPDVFWIRPESKSRVITIDQMRDLMQTIHLKPTQAEFKVAVIVAADRLNVQAANAFLKTLEEPPTNSVIVLLSTSPSQILETILSRCLRLNFAGEMVVGRRDPEFLAWLSAFAEMASSGEKSLLGRYRLLSVLLSQLSTVKTATNERLTSRSPLSHYEDIDTKMRDVWEDELTAAIEAEYRRQRAEVLTGLQWWMRDVWLQTMGVENGFLSFPDLAPAGARVAHRISAADAVGNLEQLERTQRLLTTNVQEALALEVGLLKLKL